MIFITSPDPVKAAKSLDDKTLEKTIEYSTSILLDAINNEETNNLVLWVKSSNSNYWWMFQYFNALNREFYLRNKKSHKSMKKVLELRDGVEKTPSGPTTKFINLTRIRKYNDIYDAYRKTLVYKWKKYKPTWRNSNPPEWYK